MLKPINRMLSIYSLGVLHWKPNNLHVVSLLEPWALFGLTKAVFVKVIWWIIVMKSVLFTSILLLSFECIFCLHLSRCHSFIVGAYRLRLIPACLHKTSSKPHHVMKCRRCGNVFRLYCTGIHPSRGQTCFSDRFTAALKGVFWMFDPQKLCFCSLAG